jgi:pilus assembly protein CpaF
VALPGSTQSLDIHPLSDEDLRLAAHIRESLLRDGIRPPDWRNATEDNRRAFFDAIRGHINRLCQSGQAKGLGFPLLAGRLALAPNDEANAHLVHSQAQRIYDALTGLGVLEPLLRDEHIEEIFVRDGQVAVERDGQMLHLGRLASDEHFHDMAVRVGDMTGNAIRPEQPVVLADLPGGQRFTAIVPSLSRAGTAINIRNFGQRMHHLQDLERAGAFTYTGNSQQDALEMVRDHQARQQIEQLEYPLSRFLAWWSATLAGSVLICGDFSSGKTTLLNAMSEFFPRDTPVAVLETFQELQIQHPFLARVVAPSELPAGKSGVTLGWVLNTTYTRMNPGVIAIGEVVSPPEAIEFLKATNLGRIAYTTIHGDSIRSALGRLEGMALAAQPEWGVASIRRMIVLGVRLVILTRHVPLGLSTGDDEDSRKQPVASHHASRFVKEVALLRGISPDGEYQLERLYASPAAALDDLAAGAWQAFLAENPA